MGDNGLRNKISPCYGTFPFTNFKPIILKEKSMKWENHQNDFMFCSLLDGPGGIIYFDYKLQ